MGKRTEKKLRQFASAFFYSHKQKIKRKIEGQKCVISIFMHNIAHLEYYVNTFNRNIDKS